MNFEPQKFLIGLLDFFSVLLPGMVLAYLLRVDICLIAGSVAPCPPLDTPKGVIVFLVAGYLLGHFVFLLGAWWLDELYDIMRRRTISGQVERLARWHKPSPWIVRARVWLAFKREANHAFRSANEIRRQMLRPLGATSAINTFQWAKAFLTAESPESLATVQRFEADQKFFRSFVVVLIVLLAVWIGRVTWPLILGTAALLVMSFWRYLDQRIKSTNQAYWSVITLLARKGGLTVVPPAPAADAPTHAGGVVFRKRGTKVEDLLVEASTNAAEWVLPKGRIEANETPNRTAIREVHEETGMWARIRADLGVRTFATDAGPVRLRFYLMETCARGLARDPNRKRKWVVPARASDATFEESRALVAIAEQMRRALPRETR